MLLSFCPYCGSREHDILRKGYNGNGHDIYWCLGCRVTFELKKC